MPFFLHFPNDARFLNEVPWVIDCNGTHVKHHSEKGYSSGGDKNMGRNIIIFKAFRGVFMMRPWVEMSFLHTLSADLLCPVKMPTNL